MADEERPERQHYELEPQERRAREKAEAEEGTERQGLAGDAADACPNCGKPLGSDEVLCMNCGYDMHANVVRKPNVSEEEAPDEPDLFVEPGRGSAPLLAAAGAVVTIAAMIVAGINTAVSGFNVVAAVVLPLYDVVLHTASGVLAVFIVAKLVEERFTNPELVAARMFVAFALFRLCFALEIPLPAVGGVLKVLLGLGAYWVAVWWLFRKTPAVTLVILAAHLALWAFVSIGGVLYEAATPNPAATP